MVTFVRIGDTFINPKSVSCLTKAEGDGTNVYMECFPEDEPLYVELNIEAVAAALVNNLNIKYPNKGGK